MRIEAIDKGSGNVHQTFTEKQFRQRMRELGETPQGIDYAVSFILSGQPVESVSMVYQKAKKENNKQGKLK
jgi:hypothetical protein